MFTPKAKRLMFGAVLMSLLTPLANAIPLITNGDFATGTFAGWSTLDNGGTGGCLVNVWEVNNTGHQGCTSYGTTTPAPLADYAAYNTFDGQGGSPYELWQNILLPSSISSASLSFDYTYHMNYSSALRTFSVDLYDATNTTLLGNIFSVQPGYSENIGWTNAMVDISGLLSTYSGQNVTLRFSEDIPQSYSGPAGFGIDNISLNTSVPEPTSLALLGIGLVGFGMSRRKK